MFIEFFVTLQPQCVQVMSYLKNISTALISVYHKDGLDTILELLNSHGVKFISTGGTRAHIQSLGYECEAVENLTGYPSIFGGRVKTLHPKVFGGILNRRNLESDRSEAEKYQIPAIDLVIVDLYPFTRTVASGATKQEIIEKIDIGGISLIRAAAKNFNDVAIVASKSQYPVITDILTSQGAATTPEQRTMLAAEAFAVSSAYDTAIFNYMASLTNTEAHFRLAVDGEKSLRYGENPHQKASFFGVFDSRFTQLHGKEVSYNNLLDIDAAVNLIDDFSGTTVAVIKHNNACGLATRPTVLEAWKDALAGDPVSAFGGIIISNTAIDKATAEDIDKIFFEVIIAPDFSDDALEILKHKKNRIILRRLPSEPSPIAFRSALGGVLVQEADRNAENPADLQVVTKKCPTEAQIADMLFANRIVKHSKSNAIVLARNGQLFASGVGQTSRVDALRQAIAKAQSFGFDLKGAVMASDAFFPFPDCVEIAHEAGIEAVIHPGGSIRDGESVDFCDSASMAMVITGVRHFKH